MESLTRIPYAADLNNGKETEAMAILLNRDIIEYLTTPKLDMPDTVDGLLYGSPDETVTGIGTTHVATQETVERARAMGINFLITHEGIFFMHRGSHPGIESDPVWQDKDRAIRESGVSIFRNHDHIHRYQPDLVTIGLLERLGWEGYETTRHPAMSIAEIPEITVRALAEHIKERLGLRALRFIGEDTQSIRRIALFVGYRGNGAMPLMLRDSVDAVLYGEGFEWETPEYFRDAVWQGKRKALFVLGHAESEMPGMEALARRLQERFPDVPVRFLEQECTFRIL